MACGRCPICIAIGSPPSWQKATCRSAPGTHTRNLLWTLGQMELAASVISSLIVMAHFLHVYGSGLWLLSAPVSYMCNYIHRFWHKFKDICKVTLTFLIHLHRCDTLQAVSGHLTPLTPPPPENDPSGQLPSPPMKKSQTMDDYNFMYRETVPGNNVRGKISDLKSQR